MLKKFFSAVLLAAGAAVSAADIAALDLNFYSTGAISVKAAGRLPAGVVMQKPIKYRNPQLKGLAYPIRINLDKTKSVELSFVVTGTGRICPSLSGHVVNARGKRAGKLVYKCTAFEFCDEPSAKKLPLTIEKWTNMLPKGIDVTDGETVTVKATFEKAD